MSILTIIQNAARSIGIIAPSTAISNDDEDIQQLLYFAREEMRELSHSHDWEELTKEGQFTDADSPSTTLSLPADFLRLCPNTMWHRDNNREVLFPVSSPHWAHLKGWEVVTTLRRRGRIRGGSVIFYDTVTANDLSNIYFEYISKYPVRNAADSVEKEDFTADDDEFAMSDHLLTLGTVWRYLQARDMSNYQSAYIKYSAERDRIMGADGASRGLNLKGSTNSKYVPGVTVQDNGYGV